MVVEAVGGVAQGSGLGVCTGGFRGGPAQDCGGTDIYQLIEAAADPGNARAVDAAAELAEIFGSAIDAEALVGTDYDPEEINGALEVDWGAAKDSAASGRPRPLDLSVLPPPVADLLDAVRTSPERRFLRPLVGRAGLAAPGVGQAAAAGRGGPPAWGPLGPGGVCRLQPTPAGVP